MLSFVCDRMRLSEMHCYGQGWQGYDTSHDTKLGHTQVILNPCVRRESESDVGRAQKGRPSMATPRVENEKLQIHFTLVQSKMTFPA